MATQPTSSPAATADPPARPWTLPRGNAARARVVIGRALRRRCPYCGAAGIFTNWWTLRERCPACHVSFVREDGYFLGAYALNLIFAEFLGLGLALYLLFGTGLRDLPMGWQMVLAAALAAFFPILLFPYARTLWMALDLLFNPPGENPERYLRGRDMHRPSPPT